jgi:predicted DCC family thiol-disulfide oxidoreductase YuxK
VEDIVGERMPVPEYTVLFDGECPICRGAVERLRRWDREGRLRYLPAAAPEVEASFPWIPAEALQESLHLVGPDRQTWEGAGAVEELVRVLPGWRWATRIFHLPGARWIARRGYRWIAANRFAFRCGEQCGSAGSPRDPHH